MPSLQFQVSSAVTVWVVFCINASTCFVSNTPFGHKSLGFQGQLFDRKVSKRSLYKSVVNLEAVESIDLPLFDLGFPQVSDELDSGVDSTIDLPQFELIEKSAAVNTAFKSLVPLSKREQGIFDLIDIEHPYYALQNECEIIDGTTKEQEGFVCSVRREMPVSRENGGISFGEVGRHSAAAASVAAALKNPKKSRHHYLASGYSWEVVPRKVSVIDQQMASVMNSEQFSMRPDSDECTIYCRCAKMEKRSTLFDVYFETKDVLYHLTLKLIIVPARAFMATIPKESKGVKLDQIVSRSHNPYHKDEMCSSSLKLKNVFNQALHDDWVTVEASLDKVKCSDCFGHFYEGCAYATPHSLMLVHNGDLIGHAISQLTGRSIPYKKSLKENRYADAWGIKMVDWKCLPTKLNYADSEGLDFEVKAYLSEGLLGEIGSKYAVQCRVMGSESKEVSYESSGTFVLDKVH